MVDAVGNSGRLAVDACAARDGVCPGGEVVLAMVDDDVWIDAGLDRIVIAALRCAAAVEALVGDRGRD